MTELIIGGVFTLVATSIGAAVAWRQAKLAHESAERAESASRRKELEELLTETRKGLDIAQRREHLHYLWNRQLVDHIYQGKPPPPPAAPPGLLDN